MPYIVRSGVGVYDRFSFGSVALPVWLVFAGSTQVGQGGLGYSILYALSQLQTDYLFALVFAATILGFGFFFVVMFLEWYFLHRWHESARTPETE